MKTMNMFVSMNHTYLCNFLDMLSTGRGKLNMNLDYNNIKEITYLKVKAVTLSGPSIYGWVTMMTIIQAV